MFLPMSVCQHPTMTSVYCQHTGRQSSCIDRIYWIISYHSLIEMQSALVLRKTYSQLSSSGACRKNIKWNFKVLFYLHMKFIAEKYVFIKDILGLLIIQTVGTPTFIEWIEEKSMNRMEKECHNCQAEAYFGEAKIGLRDSLVVFTGDLFVDIEQHPKVVALGSPRISRNYLR